MLKYEGQGHTGLGYSVSWFMMKNEWLYFFSFVFETCKGGSSCDAILAHFFHAEHDNDRPAQAKYSIAYNL